jgi:septal ring factor EnvC (AmiA/AmiB activator)
MLIPWIKVAGTIYEVGKVLLAGKELADQANDILKTRKRSTDTQEQLAARVQQLEDALAKQLELHRQYQVQMELLRSALEEIQKSLRWAVIIASAAIVLGIAAMLFNALK